jgi:glutathione peroxidase
LIIRFLITLLGAIAMALPTSATADTNNSTTDTAYQFTFHTLHKNTPLPLANYKGKVILIVNTASHCGFSQQYAALEQLYKKYKDRGFEIIGVPSNDFGGQEPGSSEEIATFCKVNYGVSFPMTQKEIVSGDKAHPFYLWAAQKLGLGPKPKWNFHKYLINRKGELIDYFNSTTSPDASQVNKAIEKALNEQP